MEKGYKVVYKNEYGEIETTYFSDIFSAGEPFEDIDNEELICTQFYFAHPNCTIISCDRCTMDALFYKLLH